MRVSTKISALMLAGAFLAPAAFSQSPAIDAKKARELFDGHECAGCHQLDMKVVGPAMKQVAAKYRDDKDAPAKLLKKVKAGGVGVWGEIPMPPNVGISDDELKVVLAWVLSM